VEVSDRAFVFAFYTLFLAWQTLEKAVRARRARGRAVASTELPTNTLGACIATLAVLVLAGRARFTHTGTGRATTIVVLTRVAGVVAEFACCGLRLVLVPPRFARFAPRVPCTFVIVAFGTRFARMSARLFFELSSGANNALSRVSSITAGVMLTGRAVVTAIFTAALRHLILVPSVITCLAFTEAFAICVRACSTTSTSLRARLALEAAFGTRLARPRLNQATANVIMPRAAMQVTLRALAVPLRVSILAAGAVLAVVCSMREQNLKLTLRATFAIVLALLVLELSGTTVLATHSAFSAVCALGACVALGRVAKCVLELASGTVVANALSICAVHTHFELAGRAQMLDGCADAITRGGGLLGFVVRVVVAGGVVVANTIANRASSRGLPLVPGTRRTVVGAHTVGTRFEGMNFPLVVAAHRGRYALPFRVLVQILRDVTVARARAIRILAWHGDLGLAVTAVSWAQLQLRPAFDIQVKARNLQLRANATSKVDNLDVSVRSDHMLWPRWERQLAPDGGVQKPRGWWICRTRPAVHVARIANGRQARRGGRATAWVGHGGRGAARHGFTVDAFAILIQTRGKCLPLRRSTFVGVRVALRAVEVLPRRAVSREGGRKAGAQYNSRKRTLHDSEANV
jgi:hypothetical protein